MHSHWSRRRPNCASSGRHAGCVGSIGGSRGARRNKELCAVTGRKASRLAQAVVETLAGSDAEVEAETLCDTLSDAQAMVEMLADL